MDTISVRITHGSNDYLAESEHLSVALAMAALAACAWENDPDIAPHVLEQAAARLRHQARKGRERWTRQHVSC